MYQVGYTIAIFSVSMTTVVSTLGEHEEPYIKKLCSDFDGVQSDGDCEFGSENKESEYKDYVCNDNNSHIKYTRECYQVIQMMKKMN